MYLGLAIYTADLMFRALPDLRLPCCYCAINFSFYFIDLIIIIAPGISDTEDEEWKINKEN